MRNIYYGEKDGKIVSIDDVCSGKKCECICPSCKKELIAKKGKIMIHHFAHASNVDCKYGYETSLHLLAKDIIKNSNYFVLPKESLNANYYHLTPRDVKNYTELKDAYRIEIDRVEIEYMFDDLKPDVVIYSGNKKYFVEIYVTHKVDEEKREKIKTINVDTIEINLSKFDEENEKEALADVLLNDDPRKEWVYNANIEKTLNVFRREYYVPTTMHGCAWHTQYCPTWARKYQGKSYANVIDDCMGCEHFIEVTTQSSMYDHGGVICTAAKEYKKQYVYNKWVCPKCNAKLKVKDGPFGQFIGCTRFPKCDYKRSKI